MSPTRRQTLIVLSRTPEGYHGRIGRHKAEITVDNSVKPREIHWRVCINRRWIGGAAITTAAAIEDIEQAIRVRSSSLRGGESRPAILEAR